jgi:Holliday junction resolvase RusA-like endonuclease
MLPIKLDITGVPKPRMTQSDRWKRRPCTERYWTYKDRLVELWGDRELPDTFHVIFTMPMPAGWTEKRKAMFDGKPHQQKPDSSNLLKAFEDCLWDDDSTIWDERATKFWGREGSIYVRELELFKIDKL